MNKNSNGKHIIGGSGHKPKTLQRFPKHIFSRISSLQDYLVRKGAMMCEQLFQYLRSPACKHLKNRRFISSPRELCTVLQSSEHFHVFKPHPKVEAMYVCLPKQREDFDEGFRILTEYVISKKGALHLDKEGCEELRQLMPNEAVKHALGIRRVKQGVRLMRMLIQCLALDGTGSQLYPTENDTNRRDNFLCNHERQDNLVCKIEKQNQFLFKQEKQEPFPFKQENQAHLFKQENLIDDHFPFDQKNQENSLVKQESNGNFLFKQENHEQLLLNQEHQEQYSFQQESQEYFPFKHEKQVLLSIKQSNQERFPCKHENQELVTIKKEKQESFSHQDQA